MSERHKPHNGRDRSGHFRVRQRDVDDLTTDPEGAHHLRDDVRLGGAVEDIGVQGGQHGKRISDLVGEDRAARQERVERGPGDRPL